MKPVSHLSPSKTAFADEVLRGDLLPGARQQIESLRDEWRGDDRGAVGRAVRNKMVGCGATRGRELEKTVLPAYLEGTQRVTLTALIYEYRIQQVLKSFPLDEAPPKRPTVLGTNTKALDDGRRRAGLTVARRKPHLRPQPKPSEPVKAVHERPADAPRRGRPRTIKPDLAAQPAE
jgi:hypothetical protein